ncbi:phosphate transport system substrate-binding protein [Sedimentibacter acidaminivorans]|uniref:Phosphate transport system substrate-binding protein n=1 Tax=Sedimentibacter acidaminivorans TaxID=913099 RepID=A0ABS4GA53_9FIRM|nr:substrate-binding domain-containing protein [Sedimentibacter acidaminivorans]MBP1924565.1 phosphate transport system substrate-binding protein [Sedimentibacter acidaminivorans]
MKIVKKLIVVLSLALMVTLVFTGCAKEKTSASQPTENANASDFNSDKDITVIARDSASGTRGAFHELMKIKVKEGDKEIDKLVVGALEFDGTDKVITAVEGDKYAIGYISLGSVSDRIKAASVDSVEATIENVKNKSYKVARPFLLVTKGVENELVKNFLSFADSKQGQEIVESKHYISAVDSPVDYVVSSLSGNIKVAGSTSVTPVMETLQEAYQELNPGVTFEMQSQGSSQGIKAAIDGTYDIGMSSRELKDDEKSKLNEHVLAIDGIAVILNNQNPTSDLSSENITKIFTGEATKWSEVTK